MTRVTRFGALGLWIVTGVTSLEAQPPPPTTKGCCCMVEGVAYRCTEKTQAECLAQQPGAPVFSKVDDWRKTWNEYVASSREQAAKPSHGGWVAGSCGADIDPAAGQPRTAPTGSCCMPQRNPSGDDRFDCEPGMTNFDCKAECSFFKDGRVPSSCAWTQGACRQ